jgi:ligand-binding sensor domain-containing protein
MKRITFLALWVSCGWSLHAGAALPGLAPDHFHARSWSVEQGLPQVSVLAVLQGPRGFIWAGTQNGLARFDGSRFKIFYAADNPGLSGNYITSLAFDGRGRLWIGTPKGASWFANGRFHSLAAAGTGIHAIASDGAHIWIGGQGGLGEIDAADSSLTPRVLLADPVHSLLLRGDGTLAAGGKGRVWIFRKGEGAGGITLLQPAAVVNALAEYDDSLWIGTGGGLYRLSHGTVARTTLKPVAHLYVRALFEHDGRLWIGADHGLFRLSGTAHVDDFRAVAGLESIWVRAFGSDREDNLWIGTMGGGLVRLRGNDLAYLGHDAGLGNPIAWSLYQDPDGDVWIGTENGVYRYAQGDRRIHAQFDRRKLPAPMVSSFLRDGKHLWIGTLRGLAVAVDGRLTALPKGLAALPPVQVYALTKQGGGLWIGTAQGLYRYADGRLHAYSAADGLTTARVRVIYKTGGSVWIGTERGLFAERDGRFKPLGTAAGLGSESIQSISSDGDSIWIGTRDGGLFRYRDGHFTNYSQDDGLPAQLIVNAIGDGHGNLWLSN